MRHETSQILDTKCATIPNYNAKSSTRQEYIANIELVRILKRALFLN